VSKRISHKALMTSFLSSATMCLSISLMIIGVAHAEQYCKSVDKDGNATYTLAPKNGCHAKKMKTVAIHHYIMPAVPATPNPNAQKPTDAKPAELKSNPTQEKSPAPVAPAPAPAAAVAPPAR
jgi:hypothetical protein